MPIPVLQMTLGDTDLDLLPPRAAVTFDGGGRTTSERVALDGTLIRSRPQRPASRRLNVSSPEAYVIRAAHADALLALAESNARFTLTLRGYVLEGVYQGCSFEGRPAFEPSPDPAYRHYRFTLYIP